MKVALCFSGLPRFVKETYPYWKKCLLDPYQPDVFIHTWKQTTDYTELLHTFYSPIGLATETSKQYDTSIYNEDRALQWPFRTSHQTQISQYTGIKKSLQLRQNWEDRNGFKYDIVIRARFDWFLEKVNLEINDFINIAHTPTLKGHLFMFRGKEYLGISDQFAYGTSDNMTVYSQLVDNLPILYKEYKIDFCGELFLKSHLLYHNVDVKEHKWTNGIVRDWGVMP